MNSKTYLLPNGKKAVFEYDVCGIGKITLECMDELMGMIADRPQGGRVMKPFPIWCDKCAKQNECHIKDCVPKCYEPKNEPQRNMAEDIVESFGFKKESYRQAKAKTEPQTSGIPYKIETSSMCKDEP